MSTVKIESSHSFEYPQLIVCVNKYIKKYLIGWNVKKIEDGYSFLSAFITNPTLDDIKQVILAWHNEQIDERILTGFKWQGIDVWLSRENQFNYKVAYDYAIKSDGKNLPLLFKFGTMDNPVYYEFTTVAELEEFFDAAMAYVSQVLADGWKEKDSIDWSLYNIE